MTSARSYKQVLSKNMALIELETCAGSSFDPKVVDVFLTKVANRIDSILSESNIAD
jgi:HD-GYP domain-containing protein (c-di-GMP phosphodiesterase class II)